MQLIRPDMLPEALSSLFSVLDAQNIQLELTTEQQLKITGNKSALTPELLVLLKHHKADLIELLLQQQRMSLRRRDLDKAPLSTYQRGLWFLMQMTPDSSAYNSHFEFDLNGPLDVQRLEASWLQVLQRHDVLRTRYIYEDGQPYQFVCPELWPAFELIDFNGWSAQDVEQFCRQFVNMPFSLEQGQLCRAALLQLAPEQFVLLLSLHHIVIDLWSVELLMSEMFLLYEQQQLPALPIQYTDFAAWQAERWSCGADQTHIRFWQQYLAEANKTSLVFRELYQQPAKMGMAGNYQLCFTNMAEVNLLSQQLQVSPFSLYLTTFQLLLAALSGESDVTIGTPLINRGDQRLEGVIGYFTNVLPVRLQLGERLTVADIFRAGYQSLLQVVAHQDMTLDQIAQQVGAERDISHSPFFSIVFTYHQQAQRGAIGVPSAIKIEPRTVACAEAQFELSVTLVSIGDELQLSIVYDQGCHEPTFIRDLAVFYQALLQTLISQPETLWQEVTLPQSAIQPVEHTVFERGNWLQQFYRQVQQQPERLACLCGPQQLSYRQLWQQVCDYAGYLQACGVSPQQPVALQLSAGVDYVVALLATWQLAAVAVPVAVRLPLQQQLDICQRAGCDWVIVSGAVQQPGQLLSFSQLASRTAPTLTQCAPVNNGHAAVMFFTSGSSGQPKPVRLSHDALWTLATAMEERLDLQPTDRVLQLASVGFSVFLEECLPAWHCGAAVVFPDETVLLQPASFAQMLQQHQISVAELSVGFWQQLILSLEAGEVELPESLRILMLGCDSVAAHWYRRWPLPQVRLLTVFGLTETVVTNATCLLDDVALPAYCEKFPLGEPAPGSRLYVLDGHGRPVMPWSVGYLWIAGPVLSGVSFPAATMHRVLKDPFVRDTPAIMYNTGDLVKCGADGLLWYLGRKDRQLKINGFRLELGEIEAHLQQLTGATSCLVRSYREHDSTLLFALVAGQMLPPAEQILTQLRGRLAYYKIPSALQVVPEIQLNQNGKPDEAAIYQLFQRSRQADTAQTEFLTENEQKVAKLFADLLKIPLPSRQGHFFRLGGHSLLAMQLMLQLKTQFSVQLTLKQIFEHPTVSALATMLEPQQAAVQLPVLVSADPLLPVPLSFAQRRMWFVDHLLQGSSQYNMPAAFILKGAFDEHAFCQSWLQIMKRHASLRTNFREEQGHLCAQIQDVVTLPLRRIDLSELAPEQQQATLQQLANDDVVQPFDLAVDLMLRLSLVRLSANCHAILLNIHHIAADGWSFNILIAEFNQFYQAAIHQQPAALPDLAVSYADYCHWQQQWLDNELIQAELKFWRDYLADVPLVHALPLDYPRPKTQSFAGKHWFNKIDAATMQQVHTLCQSADVTEFMFWQTMLSLLLARFSGSHDIVMGTPVAGRIRSELEPVVGCFINTLVLRTCWQPQSLHDALATNKQNLLSVFSHQHLPFEVLVDALNPARSTAHSPLFQILFRLDNIVVEPAQLTDGLVLEPLAQQNNTVQYELMLTVSPQGEQMQLCWSYAETLFEDHSIEALADSFVVLLKQCLRQPDVSVWDLPLTDESLTAAMLATPALPPHAEPPALIWRYAAQRPQDIAVEFAGEQLSYAALVTAAELLSLRLREAGVNPGELIGVLQQRSPLMIVSILAIWHCGAVFVPLDPSYPESRLVTVVQDSQLTTLLDTAQTRDLLSLPQLRRIDAAATSGASPTVTGHWPTWPTDRVAYLMYTSGTTGRPKGIAVPMRGLMTFIPAMLSVLPAQVSQAPWFMLTSINFDIAMFEWLGCLSSGYRLQIINEQLHQDPIALTSLLNQQKIGFIQTTPTRFAQLLECGLQLTAGTVVACGGESLPQGLAEQLLQQQVQLFNCYGPTETTVWSMVQPVHTKVGDGMLRLGGALPGYTHVVLDPQGQLSPVAAVGELYIGGPAVADGYYRQADLTAAKFVQLPMLSPEPTTWFRTGDLVRRHRDGGLTYCGRADHQLKLRGYRIEPEEIEYQLAQLAPIRQAVVCLRQDKLVAFVVPVEKVATITPLDAAQTQWLNAALAMQLPPSMLPSLYTALPALPMTPNGKVDRQQLLHIPVAESVLAADPAQTPTELFIAAAWAELLRIDAQTINRDDNFFALGGHSLLTVRLLFMLKQEFQLNLPVILLFEHPRLQQLAAHIDNLVWLQHSQMPAFELDEMELIDL